MSLRASLPSSKVKNKMGGDNKTTHPTELLKELNEIMPVRNSAQSLVLNKLQSSVSSNTVTVSSLPPQFVSFPNVRAFKSNPNRSCFSFHLVNIFVTMWVAGGKWLGELRMGEGTLNLLPGLKGELCQCSSEEATKWKQMSVSVLPCPPEVG